MRSNKTNAATRPVKIIVVGHLNVVRVRFREHFQVRHRLPDAAALQHRQDEVKRIGAGGQREHLDFVFVDRDHRLLAAARVLRREVHEHGTLERVRADLTGVRRQQVHVEAAHGELEESGLLGHG